VTFDLLFQAIFFMTISGVLSASEIVLFTLSRLQLKQLREHSPGTFSRVQKLVQDPLGLLVTVLVLNEIVNVSFGSLITRAFVEKMDMPNWIATFGVQAWVFKTIVGVLITTPIVLLFLELTPKILGSRTNRLVVTLFSPFILFSYRAFYPVHVALKWLFPRSELTNDPTLSSIQEDDFLVLAEEQTEHGHIHETELELIRNVFQLDDVAVEEIAVPLRKIQSIREDATLGEAFRFLSAHPEFTRIPVHSGYRDQIVGVLHIKDLLQLRLDDSLATEKVSTLMHEALFTQPSSDLETLFRKMRSKKTHIAFLRNSYGKVVGMISLQKILDHLFEEVFEEE